MIVMFSLKLNDELQKKKLIICNLRILKTNFKEFTNLL